MDYSNEFYQEKEGKLLRGCLAMGCLAMVDKEGLNFSASMLNERVGLKGFTKAQ